MSTAASSDLSDFLELLQNLVREPSVVGTEDSFFRVLRRELEEIDIHVERHHGVLVARGSEPESLVLSAHIDRHGLLCTGPNEFQYAAFIAGNRGELTGDSVSEQMMASIADRFTGQRVQAHLPYTGTYLGQGVISNGYHCEKRHNLIFEIDGLDFLQPGAPVSFLDRLQVTETHISAQLDNVLSVALIVHLFRNGFQGTALLTAQEEAGRSWRYALSWFQRESITTRRLLVLDTSPYPSPEAAAEQQLVLRKKDATAPFDPAFTAEITRICERLGISYSYKDEWLEARHIDLSKPVPLGRTELGRLVAATGGAISGTTLQIPTTGYHTASETASLDSVRAALRLLGSYIP
ncbi:peptidase M42 [Haloferula chungangensis]|uniref:Peptidase M42 n=1 Tax=Haloferula chungangensis TaxID=1048331 RepID=A0ABW2L6I7_9BACT